MALETGTYISDLVATNPTASDPKNQGDDHIRFIKSTVKATFPNVTGAVIPTHTELNYVDGVTSAIQDQLDEKAPLDSPVFTGTPEAPTAAVGTTGAQVATLDFVIAASLSASLPGQTGNAGKLISTDGTNGFWENEIDGSVVSLAGGGDIVGTTATQTLDNKTISSPILEDATDGTKKANVILTGITAGQNRDITLADEDMTLFTPYARLIAKVTVSSPSATVDLEDYFTTDYDHYFITLDGLQHDAASTRNLNLRFKMSGSYQTTGYLYRISPGSLTSGAVTIPALTSIGTVASNNTSYLRIDLPRPHEAKEPVIGLVGANSALTAAPIYAGNSTAAAITGLRFYMSADNITAGTFRIFGVRKT